MSDSVADYETDMQTIRDYVQAVAEAQTRLALVYTNALANVETTMQQASPAEARPEFVGAMLKSGIKAVEKFAIAAVKAQTGADLGPLVDMVHAISDELSRAEAAGASLAAGEWIKLQRTSITNAYSHAVSTTELRKRIEDEYNNGDEGQRSYYIAGIQNELAAMMTVKPPPVEKIAMSMYEAWINLHFNDDCMDGTGNIVVLFDADGALESSTVNAPLGSRVAGAINGVMGGAGVGRVMDLQVIKKVCRDGTCMCFEQDGRIRKDTDDEAASQFLQSTDTWSQVRRLDG